MKKNSLSIISPVKDEEENLFDFYNSLIYVLNKISFFYEIIFVNDGSTDGSLKKLKTLRSKDKRVKIIDFSRNFGREAAVTCGIDYASLDAFIVIDSDLQDSPKYIFNLVESWQNGADIVFTKRKSRKDSFGKRITAFLFYRFLNLLTPTKMSLDTGDFCLFDKKVANELRKLKEKNRYLRGLLRWLGFKQVIILVDREKRKKGRSSYSVRKMIDLAFSAIISFSYWPLRLVGFLGVFILIGGIFLVFTPFGQSFDAKILNLIICFLFGLLFLVLGIIGRYLATIHDEVLDRPLYIINELIGFDDRQKR